MYDGAIAGSDGNSRSVVHFRGDHDRIILLEGFSFCGMWIVSTLFSLEKSPASIVHDLANEPVDRALAIEQRISECDHLGRRAWTAKFFFDSPSRPSLTARARPGTSSPAGRGTSG